MGGGLRRGRGVEGGVRWTIWECVRCDIWGRAAADTNVEFVGIKSIGSGFNIISQRLRRNSHPSHLGSMRGWGERDKTGG